MQDRVKSGSITATLVLLGFFGVGVALIIGGVVAAWDSAGLVMGAAKATGRVARHEVTRSDDGINYYYPVVAFRDARGERIEFRSDLGSSSQPYRVGAPIEVLYNVRDPHHAQINSFGALWGGPGIAFLMGLGSVGLASIGFIAFRESIQRPRTVEGQAARAVRRLPSGDRGPITRIRVPAGLTASSLILLAFFVVGLGLIIGGASWAWCTNDFIKGAAKAPGRVVGYETSRSAGGSLSRFLIVKFEGADGEKVEFRSQIDASSRPYGVGAPVEVLYDPRNPYRAEINSFGWLWSGPMTLLLLGLFFAGLSSFIFVIFRKGDQGVRAAERIREETARRLRSHGRRLRTRVDQVAQAPWSDKSGRHSYKIVSQWHNPDTGEVHVFESEPIGFDPQGHLPEAVFVYVDPKDPKVYHMDTSFLPQGA